MSTLYLFGAGASANSVPLVKNFTDSIKLPREFTPEADEFEASFLNEVKAQLVNFRSIDTLARKYKIANKETEYIRLKRLIDHVITFYSVVGFDNRKNEVSKEYRYLALMTDLLFNLENEFSDEHLFLSWNYDSVLELNFSELLSLEETKMLNSIYKKINGSTNFFKFLNEENGSVMSIENMTKLNYSTPKEIRDLMFQYSKYLEKSDSLLSFSWDRHQSVNELLGEAFLKKLRNVKNLVVIGYSFPYYNRHIDRQILQELRVLYEGTITVQDIYPKSAAQRLSELLAEVAAVRFETPTEIFQSITQYDTTDSFYVPPEYYLQ